MLRTSGQTGFLAACLAKLPDDLQFRTAVPANREIYLSTPADWSMFRLANCGVYRPLPASVRKTSPQGARKDSKTPVVLLLGPDLSAVSGVSTHLNLLFASSLAQQFSLRHFKVGREGREENFVARMLRFLASPFMLAKEIVTARVDIVHLNTSIDPRAYWRDVVYMLVARLCATRVVYQIHGGDLPEAFCGNHRLLRTILRASLSLSDAIVVLARCELEAYRAFIPGADIRVFPNAIDYAPYATLDRRRHDRQAPLRLVYIGRLARDKGLFDALEGVRRVCLQGGKVRFLIAGSGPDEADLRQCVKKMALSSEVSFARPVFGDAKIALLAEADVLLFPTFHREGLPYALLECMAAGIPAITTRVGAIPDVMADGVHGLFVLPGDVDGIARAIVRLAGNPSQLAQMGVACRERIKSHYTIQRLSDHFSRLYSEIIAGTHAGDTRVSDPEYGLPHPDRHP
jgi:glycosyltransferase involved in cell wall biosynthesis